MPSARKDALPWATALRRRCDEFVVRVDREHDCLRPPMRTEEDRCAVALAEAFEQAGESFASFANRQYVESHGASVPECVHKPCHYAPTRTVN